MRARLRFALDQTGGDADHALEGSSERDLGAEAEPVGELRHRGPRALQRIVATSAPAADVLPNRLSHQLGEPRGEGRAGHRNGFYDTANAMATTIATRALPAKVAVALAGVLTRSGAFLLYAFGGAQKLGQLGANRRKTRRGRARGCEGRVSTAPSRVSGALARGQARPGVRPVAGATTTRRRRSSSAGSSQGWRPSTRSWPRRWSTPRSDLARNSARRCCTSRARPITRSSTASPTVRRWRRGSTHPSADGSWRAPTASPKATPKCRRYPDWKPGLRSRAAPRSSRRHAGRCGWSRSSHLPARRRVPGAPCPHHQAVATARPLGRVPVGSALAHDVPRHAHRHTRPSALAGLALNAINRHRQPGCVTLKGPRVTSASASSLRRRRAALRHRWRHHEVTSHCDRSCFHDAPRPRIRLLGRADRARLVRRPRRAGMGKLMPRLAYPLRRRRARRAVGAWPAPSRRPGSG